MANRSNDDTLYSFYGEAGFSWPLVTLAIVLNIPAFAGMVLNSALIWVTYRIRSLHGTANYLLAFYSFFELIHQHGHLLFLYMALSGKNFLPYGLAIQICLLSIVGFSGNAISMAFTGFDRLLAVVFPTFYIRLKPKPYLFAITLICLAISLIQTWTYLYNDVDPSLMITGTIGDFFQGYAGALSAAFTFPAINITIVLYVSIGIALKFKTVVASNTSEDLNHRVFFTLFIIIIFNISGFYAAWVYRLFIMPNIPSDVTNWFAIQGTAVFLNFAAASNAPILYFTRQVMIDDDRFKIKNMAKLNK